MESRPSIDMFSLLAPWVAEHLDAETGAALIVKWERYLLHRSTPTPSYRLPVTNVTTFPDPAPMHVETADDDLDLPPVPATPPKNTLTGTCSSLRINDTSAADNRLVAVHRCDLGPGLLIFNGRVHVLLGGTVNVVW